MDDTKTFGEWLRWDFLNCSGGSSDVLFGIKIYGNGNFEKPWFQKTVWPAYRLARRIHNMRLWFRYRLFPDYRQRWIVKTGLRPGWHDSDTLILHSAMAILCHYIEWECGGDQKLDEWTADLLKPGSEGHGSREAIERQASTQSESVVIYRWWKVQKPADEARRDFLLHELYGKKDRITFKQTEHPLLNEMVFEPFQGEEEAMEREFRALEDKIADDEQKMLHRLIDIRQCLWT